MVRWGDLSQRQQYRCFESFEPRGWTEEDNCFGNLLVVECDVDHVCSISNVSDPLRGRFDDVAMKQSSYHKSSDAQQTMEGAPFSSSTVYLGSSRASSLRGKDVDRESFEKSVSLTVSTVPDCPKLYNWMIERERQRASDSKRREVKQRVHAITATGLWRLHLLKHQRKLDLGRGNVQPINGGMPRSGKVAKKWDYMPIITVTQWWWLGHTGHLPPFWFPSHVTGEIGRSISEELLRVDLMWSLSWKRFPRNHGELDFPNWNSVKATQETQKPQALEASGRGRGQTAGAWMRPSSWLRWLAIVVCQYKKKFVVSQTASSEWEWEREGGLGRRGAGGVGSRETRSKTNWLEGPHWMRDTGVLTRKDDNRRLRVEIAIRAIASEFTIAWQSHLRAKMAIHGSASELNRIKIKTCEWK